mmetsp:Transcript_90627/g.270426  ORF Transcript_90627/g.270426 Transcript_90627/m.270426 type:complete len:278 (+) Transcript_90627:313-1146(+)
MRIDNVCHPEGADLIDLLLALDLPEHDLVVLPVHHHGALCAVHLYPVLEGGPDARRGVDRGGGAAGERDDGGADVLDLDVVAGRPRFGKDTLDIPHERVHEVQDVRGLRRQAAPASQFAASRPPVVVGVAVVAGVPELLVLHVAVDQPAQAPCLDRILDPAGRLAEAHLVDARQHHSTVPASTSYLQTLLEGGVQRLLDNQMLPSLRGRHCEVAVKSVGHADDRDAYLGVGAEVLVRAVRPLGPPLGPEGLRLLGAPAEDSDKLYLLHPLKAPRVGL